MKCIYCGQMWEPDKYHPKTCAQCGAPKPEPEKIGKYDPFFYDGMIVYELVHWERLSCEWVFYRGIELVGRVEITQRELESIVPLGYDLMPLVMERLQQ